VAIMANRRTLLKAIDAVANGETPVGLADPNVATQRFGPDTVDGIAPAAQWQQWWQDAAAEKRKGAPWNARIETAATVD
jgi:phthalate 4,5-dioxygenase